MNIPLLIASCVQIIVESIPCSSSGHVALTFLFAKQTTEFSELYNGLLHIPTLMSIAIVFWAAWTPAIRELIRFINHGFKTRKITKESTVPLHPYLYLAGCLILSNLITIFFEPIKGWYTKTPFTLHEILLGGLCITALLLFSLYTQKPKNEPITFKTAAIIGFAQGIAFILPGVSRLAVTFVTARWLGASNKKSLHYSILLLTSLICAVILRAIIKHEVLTRTELLTLHHNWFIILGASIIGGVSLYLTKTLAFNNRAQWFGWYLLIPISLLLYLR